MAEAATTAPATVSDSDSCGSDDSSNHGKWNAAPMLFFGHFGYSAVITILVITRVSRGLTTVYVHTLEGFAKRNPR